jgi:hypothetical protein
MVELLRISPENRGRSGAVRTIARGQKGIVARAQLERAGFDRRAIDRALRSGRLHPVHKGVYSTQAPELATEDALIVAAVLAAGDGAVLSQCCTEAACTSETSSSMPVFHAPRSRGRCWTSPPATTSAPSDDVIDDLLDAFAEAIKLGYAKAAA